MAELATANEYRSPAARIDRGYRAPGGVEVSYGSVIESVRMAVAERRGLLGRHPRADDEVEQAPQQREDEVAWAQADARSGFRRGV